jgi:hypothetical protein
MLILREFTVVIHIKAVAEGLPDQIQLNRLEDYKIKS